MMLCRRAVLAGLLTFSLLVFGAGSVWAENVAAENGAPQNVLAAHAIALYDAPKYPAGFQHFDYVNPDAPKGGTLRLSALQTFDSVHPTILKGVKAIGAALPFESLVERSQDDPFSVYDLRSGGSTPSRRSPSRRTKAGRNSPSVPKRVSMTASR